MAQIIRKYVSVLLLLLVLIQLLPHSPATATSEVYYGEAYQDLQTDAQRTAYRLVEEGIAGLSPTIGFKGIVEIEYSDLEDVLRAVCVDHPQYFWFLESGTVAYDQFAAGNLVASFEPDYILDGQSIAASSQELADAMYAFHTKVRQIIDGIPINYTTEYEIALYLHDYLAQNVTYTLEGEHPSAYAALIQGQAACYGYSKAYQCLLNAAGIRARTITGDSPDENGKLVGHAWNQVWLDGKCYYTDVTWDDLEEVILHTCFAMSLNNISKDHIADKEFILPECGHEPMNYYSISHGGGIARWNEHTTAASAAANFRLDGSVKKEAVFYCEVQFTSSGFFDWFGRNFEDICKHMGLSEKTEAYYYNLNDAYYLTLVDKQIPAPVVSTITLNEETVSLPGAGTRYQLLPQVQSDKVWMPDLIYTSSDASVAFVDEHGLVTAVSEGTAVITASTADGSVSASCTVSVSKAPAHVHTMRMFASQKPTCTKDGYNTYYLCTGCGRHFGDEAGTVEYPKTSDYILPITHERLLLISQDGYHMQRCKCGVELTETKEKHTDANADGICEVCNLSVGASDLHNPNSKPTPNQKNASPGWLVPAVIAAVILLGVTVLFLIRRRRRHN